MMGQRQSLKTQNQAGNKHNVYCVRSAHFWGELQMYIWKRHFKWKIGGNNVSELARIEVQEGKSMNKFIEFRKRNFRFDLI